MERLIEFIKVNKLNFIKTQKIKKEENQMTIKEKLVNTLIFAIFLTGSIIIYNQLGRWVAIGVALEVLAIYLLIKLELNSFINKIKSDNKENDID